MKKLLTILVLSSILSGCSKDDDRQDNPYLIDQQISYRIDLSLPQYNDLRFPLNSVVLNSIGINGVVVYHIAGSQYTAFELTDPNHPPESCSVLSVNDTEVTCNCDDGNVYTIITGQQIAGEGKYPLKAYHVVQVGNSLEITN